MSGLAEMQRLVEAIEEIKNSWAFEIFLRINKGKLQMKYVSTHEDSSCYQTRSSCFEACVGSMCKLLC